VRGEVGADLGAVVALDPVNGYGEPALGPPHDSIADLTALCAERFRLFAGTAMVPQVSRTQVNG